MLKGPKSKCSDPAKGINTFGRYRGVLATDRIGAPDRRDSKEMLVCGFYLFVSLTIMAQDSQAG